MSQCLTHFNFGLYCFSLSAVARKRPAFYGRILPVLLGLGPSSSVTSVSKGMHLAGVHHALKNAFESCLNCTHPGAAPVHYFLFFVLLTFIFLFCHVLSLLASSCIFAATGTNFPYFYCFYIDIIYICMHNFKVIFV